MLPGATALAEFRTMVLSAITMPAKRLLPPRTSLPAPVWSTVPEPVRPPERVTSLAPPARVSVDWVDSTLTSLVMAPVAAAPNWTVTALTPVGWIRLAPAPRAESLPRVTVLPRSSVSPA